MKIYTLIADEFFEDKYDSKIHYKKGSKIVTSEKERAEDLVNRKLAHISNTLEENDPTIPEFIKNITEADWNKLNNQPVFELDGTTLNITLETGV